MKKTYKDILALNSIAGTWANKEGNQQTKLFYAIQRFFDKPEVKDIIPNMRKEKEDIMLDHALTGEKGEILFAEEQEKKQGLIYKHSKDQYKRMLEALQKHQDEYFKREVEVEPFIVEDLPELTPEEVKAFTGFFINENTQELPKPTRK